ncbi:hypothetical protein BGZ76_006755 [Entomortierella beljakovae]|nr:hypothetical protein BGZ76_006755 [Entomortierella beljakovae]
MGNTPSQQGNDAEPEGSVESVTFTNSPYHKPQGQQQYQNNTYMTHQSRTSSPNSFPLGPQDSINPSTIPIAPIPVDGTQRPRFPYVKEQYMNESPAGSSPLSMDHSYPTVGGNDKNFQKRQSQQQQQQQQQQKNSLPGGGPRRRASSLVSGQSYGQFAEAYNEQVILATAAHQDKLENQRLQQQVEGRASYRNSARVSRAFDTLDPLKGYEELNNGNTSDFTTILNLPPGTHRIKFIVDDEWKCSTELSAATDAEGNLVNFLEVTDEEQDELEGGHDSPINGTPVGSYTDQIPLYAQSVDSSPSSSTKISPLTTLNSDQNANGSNGRNPSPSKQLASDSVPNDPPPALPPHLEKAILNNVPSKEDNSILPVPNHVVLNHLYACSVKEGVLSISVTSRYRKKYITTVFIKPVVTDYSSPMTN